jgi:transmembrane sensor
MTDRTDEAAREPARTEAAAWFARMRGPDAERWAPELARWRGEAAENEAAYQRLLRKWDQTAFLGNMPLARDRDLGRAAIWSRRPLARYAAVAGVGLLLAAGIGALTLGRLRPASSVMPTEYASTDRRVQELRLADGTRVTLDAGAAIQVDAPRRRVRLVKGRARFDMAAVSGERFVVDCAGSSIAAADGQFDVSLHRGMTRVVAWRGAIDISRGFDGLNGRLIRITSGQMLAIAPSTGAAAPRPADAGEIAWTRGMLSFDDTPLADAVESINRYNGRRIALGSPAAGELRLTGAFRATDPQGFARAVAGMFHLSLRTLPDGTIVLTSDIKA